ncbi:LamG-like jellyroll fold domain-containing protein [Thalassomonas actiniarum]|uniref:Winged helix-turn-helix domain-containing protein n=1 Tax=Thalassomonas actiniarum TaxID=485447 RepID=A0AAE9YLC2_9GAMM|nr:LamG-like jellyroll fold domain-containing protein [Thalassomonas actiniarum]WDD97609.1 winged helix-turn-helix domain-containing protein [Thalassomonas actiniarum]
MSEHAVCAHDNTSPANHQGAWLGELYICLKTEKVFHNQQDLMLSALSFTLLKTLLLHAPAPLSSRELLALVWQDVVTTEENVKQRISLLRKALGQDKTRPYIQNMRGRGYFIAPPITWVESETQDDNRHKGEKTRLVKLPLQLSTIGAAFLLLTTLILIAFFNKPDTDVLLDVRIDNTVRLAPKQDDLAFCLDGLDDYIEFADQDSLDVHEEDFAISTWIRTSALEQRVIVDKRFEDKKQDVKGYVFYVDEGELGFQLATGQGSWYCHEQDSSCTLYETKTFIADGRWHHVAVSIDRDHPQGMVFYLDGEVIFTTDPTGRAGSLANDKPLRIGSRSSYQTGLFLGAIGAVNLYHTKLSTQEVAGLYQQGNNRRCYSIATKGGL